MKFHELLGHKNAGDIMKLMKDIATWQILEHDICKCYKVMKDIISSTYISCQTSTTSQIIIIPLHVPVAIQ